MIQLNVDTTLYNRISTKKFKDLPQWLILYERYLTTRADKNNRLTSDLQMINYAYAYAITYLTQHLIHFKADLPQQLIQI